MFFQVKSVSLSFSSLLDGDLNYCNLHNLLAGECPIRSITLLKYNIQAICVHASISDKCVTIWIHLFVVVFLASGLTSAPGFMEMTNEWACLGYGLSTCKAWPAQMLKSPLEKIWRT